MPLIVTKLQALPIVTQALVLLIVTPATLIEPSYPNITNRNSTTIRESYVSESVYPSITDRVHTLVASHPRPRAPDSLLSPAQQAAGSA